jgi:hypothetical protein
VGTSRGKRKEKEKSEVKEGKKQGRMEDNGKGGRVIEGRLLSQWRLPFKYFWAVQVIISEFLCCYGNEHKDIIALGCLSLPLARTPSIPLSDLSQGRHCR